MSQGFLYLFTPTCFAFGDGQERSTGELARRFGGTKVLLVCGGSVKKNGLYDAFSEAVTAARHPL